MRWAGRCGDRPLREVKRCCCRRGEHRSSAKHSQRNRRTTQWPPLRVQPCRFRQKTQDFHLIRPVFALGTFPSRGRLANAFLFLELWFFDSLTRDRKARFAVSFFYSRRAEEERIYRKQTHSVEKTAYRFRRSRAIMSAVKVLWTKGEKQWRRNHSGHCPWPARASPCLKGGDRR